MFKSVGRFATAHAWKICAAWLLLGILLSRIAPSWDSTAQDDDINFLPGYCAGVRGHNLLKEAFPQDVFASRLLFAIERPDRVLSDDDFALARTLVGDLERLRAEAPDLQIGKILSCRDPLIGDRLTSPDRHCTLIQISLGTPYLALQTRLTVDRADDVVRERLAKVADAPIIKVTGPAGIGRDLTRASAESLEGTTLATIALVVVVLLFVYRAPLLALIPLVTIAVSVWVALQLMALLTLIPGVHLVHVSKVFSIVILYGAGTDYCLFLISRYREELERGLEPTKALCNGVGAVGSSLAASAGTVICGLGMMGFAEFAKVRCAGPAIALSLTIALLASLTLTPALLQILGRAVFWPRRLSGRDTQVPISQRQTVPLLDLEPRNGFWEWVSRGVVARPMLVWGTAVLLLAPLAILGLRVTPNYRAIGELHPSADSVQGLAVVQKHFSAGEIGPLTVLLVSPNDWNTPRGKEVIAHLSRGFKHLGNVGEVRSLTQPLGVPLATPEPAVARSGAAGFLDGLRQNFANSAREIAQRMAKEHYLAAVERPEGKRYVTRIDVVLQSDPFAVASLGTLELVQTWLQQELARSTRGFQVEQAECQGVTVSSRDLAEITEADRIRVNTLVLAGIFLILLVLVRRPGLAAYLLGTVLFSYYATLGATTLMATLWSGRPLGIVDWRVPFFLFVILIAVGEDYNILLVMRVLQERRRYGNREGTRRALARTGGTITSCGLIMAGTFATLMLAGLGTLVQIGFALAFGVVIDTFVVRPFLVPAFTLLAWSDDEPSPLPTEPRPTLRLPKRRVA